MTHTQAPDALAWPDEGHPVAEPEHEASWAERRATWVDRAGAGLGLGALGLAVLVGSLTAGDLGPRAVARDLSDDGVRATAQRVEVRPAEEPGGQLGVTFEADGRTVVANAVGSSADAADEDPASLTVVHDAADPTRVMLARDVRSYADEALPRGLATTAALLGTAAAVAVTRLVRNRRRRPDEAPTRAVDPVAVALVLVVAATVSAVAVLGEEAPASWSWLGFPAVLGVTAAAAGVGVRVASNDRGAPRPTRP